MKKTIIAILAILLGILFSCGPKVYKDKSVMALKGEEGNGSVLENENDTMSYYLYLPPGYEEKTNMSTAYPLLVTLHGSGQANTTFSSAVFSTTCLPNFNSLFNPLTEKKTDKQKILSAMDSKLKDCIILIPQNRNTNSWALEDLNAVIQTIINVYRVDQTRVYMTGVSMGGIGTWDYAVKYPSRLAAAIPVCGSHSFIKNGLLIQNISSWTFHAVNDNSVRFSNSYMDFLSALTPETDDNLSEWFQTQEVNSDHTASGTEDYGAWMTGCPPPTGLHTVTVYASGGHIIWSRAYSTEGLWDWVYQQKKK